MLATGVACALLDRRKDRRDADGIAAVVADGPDSALHGEAGGNGRRQHQYIRLPAIIGAIVFRGKSSWRLPVVCSGVTT